MQQQIAVVTLGISDLERSKAFYRDGFGWTPVFENAEIAFYQMNGFVLGTWLKSSLEEDTKHQVLPGSGAVALAHNVSKEGDVQTVLDKLVAAGATVLREADEPPQGGRRGYIADPDGHIWEIAFNPMWPIDEDGHVTFKM
ncbi:VOC family protein [Oceaniovalibus sp. ACAM 378]|uniref:VOC family protein n=1 Tax=Oceaniovalibus sp. ACAM 378 TaxID=2599923 RepID=UPI0011D59947|nr:VOC family protein [Oceaniovalibus sp. ACAM 378]TYB87565.1 VOC family protein [Oceaniovalibus sp. ACAM 378]